ncbi:MAG: T9SS type A sorting domain-containing protein [Bacteroidetes bacterium]|nr:T9SS type A sorting domain-containing protein [Bacteroidota bacterium]
MRLSILFFLLLVCLDNGYSQYAPRDNWQGSTAIPKDSQIFVNWAKGAQVSRGHQDIRQPGLGFTEAGTNEFCLSYPDGQSVSLGDGGSVILQFDAPIVNGPGFDFAIFENGFHIRSNSDSDFLELAFVEVSSDGQTWVRFPSISENDTLVQLGTYDGSKASKVHNLAGKYVANFGTPFDLEELKDSAGLDVMNIRYIKIIDVVGCLDSAYATRDSRGVKINDPYPTPFIQGGFDLDAVGIIHNQDAPNGMLVPNVFLPYPNPSSQGRGIVLSEDTELDYSVYSLEGKQIEKGHAQIAGIELERGIYIIYYTSNNQTKRLKWVVQ